ncbi:MAG: GMP synthase, partial [Gelidibacter sp.]
LLAGLDDPFYAVDSRDWQLVQPRLKVFKEQGAFILSLEKVRNHVDYERAIMAVRFSKEFVGTQFHPEADPVGMRAHFLADANKHKVIANFGEETYDDMMDKLDDPDKIIRTHKIILPNFIRSAMKQLSSELIS